MRLKSEIFTESTETRTIYTKSQIKTHKYSENTQHKTCTCWVLSRPTDTLVFNNLSVLGLY